VKLEQESEMEMGDGRRGNSVEGSSDVGMRRAPLLVSGIPTVIPLPQKLVSSALSASYIDISVFRVYFVEPYARGFLTLIVFFFTDKRSLHCKPRQYVSPNKKPALIHDGLSSR